MVRLHSSTLFSVLRLSLLPALLLSLLYMFSLIKTKSEFIYHQRGIIVTQEMVSHTQQVIRKKPKYVCLSVAHYKNTNFKSSSEPITTASPQEERTATTSAELSPNKYNLMEETYGRKWSESPADMHLFSTDCTIGRYCNITSTRLLKGQICFFHDRVIEESFFFDFRIRQCKSVAAGSPVCY